MKKSIVIFLSVLLVVICIIPLSGCGNENDKIQNLMNEFEYSCNTLNVDGILDCIHPDISNKIKAAMGIVGLFSGQGSDEMLEAISSALTSNGKVDAESFFSSIKIEVKEINSNDTSGTAKVGLTYKIGAEEIVSETIFECSKYNDKWYINSLSF